MNKLSVPVALKDNIDNANVAVELGLAHRGWYIYRPNNEQAIFDFNRVRVTEMQVTDTQLGRCIGRFDPPIRSSSKRNEHSFIAMALSVS